MNDTAITRAKGQSGSVMDYNPINIAPKGQKQGDYVTTTIGPYDYWAIEYAYKPIDGDEAAELKKIAARSPEPDLATRPTRTCAGNDPLVNAYDLGSDPSRFAKDRIALAARADEGPGRQGGQGRRVVGAGPIGLRDPAEPVGQRRLPALLATSAASTSPATTRGTRVRATRSSPSPRRSSARR